MISDVLHEALSEIERYQRDCYHGYESLSGEIEAVTTVMDGLLACLDAAPGIIEEQDRLVGELRASIRNLDVSGVVAARHRFITWVEQTRQAAKRWTGEADEAGIIPLKNKADESQGDLYQSLIHVEIPTNLDSHEVVDCFLRATMVAAGIRFDKEFFQSVLRLLATKSTSVLPGSAKGEQP